MISIIIINYNGKRYLKDCLESVFAQSYSDFELILFDNHSTDGSAAYAGQHFHDSRLNVVEWDSNLGFAGGNNEALNYCNNDLIVLLNNDTVVDKDWLKHLAGAMTNTGTVASSFVITEGIKGRYYETNGSVSYLMYNVMNIFRNPESEFYPNGCSVIFRKSEIGNPFDSDYFYYSEDLYLGLKARFMNLKVKFVKDSVVYHVGGGSAGNLVRKTFYQERNRLLTLYIFFSYFLIIRIYPIILFYQTAKLCQSIFSSKYSFTGVFKAYFWFYFHIPAVFRKHHELSALKKRHERDILKFMTSKLLNHEGKAAKIINNISYYYSRFMGIKPIEYFQRKESRR